MSNEEDVRPDEAQEPVEAPEPVFEPEPRPELGPRPEPASMPHQEATPPPPPAARRLERSHDDRVIAGVCGGLGEYLGVDAVLIRIAALILVFAGGAGIVLYLIGWVAMPEAALTPAAPGGVATEPAAATAPEERRSGAFVLGLVFVVLGVFFLVDQAWPDFLSWKYIWPLALIAVGAVILLRPRR